MITFIKGGIWSKRTDIPKINNGELNLNELIKSFIPPTPEPKYKVFTALLTQNGGDEPNGQYGGVLVIGKTYTILDMSDGSFIEVGAPNNNVETSFIATGTDPNWGTDSGTGVSYNNGAPVVNILENTIGNIWFIYSDVGTYTIYSNGLFTENKTILFASSMNNGNDRNNHTATVYTSAPNELTFASWGNTGDNQEDLDNSIPLPIEIRIYN